MSGVGETKSEEYVADAEASKEDLDALIDAEAESHEPPCFPPYFQCLTHPYGKYVILVCWLVLFINGLIFAPQLTHLTASSLNAPRNTKGAKARHKVHNNYPQLVKTSGSLALVTCRECKKNSKLKITDPSVPLRNITADLGYYVDKYNDNKHDIMFNYTSYYIKTDLCTEAEERGDNADVIAGCYAGARGGFVDEDGITSIAVINHKDAQHLSDSVRDDFVDWFDNRMDDLTKRYKDDIGNLKIRYSGQLSLLVDMQTASGESIESDVYFIPLIMVIFAYTVASWRVVILPLIAILLCILTCFTFMYPVAKYMVDTSTVAPPLMTSVCMAMCIDYSLFLLVRFREEIGDNRDVIRKSELIKALRKTLHWSGEVILVSGGVLAFSLLAYAFCSFSMLESFGVGCAISVLCAISANLTLIPALILLFPSFFCYFGWSFTLTTIINDEDEESDAEKQPILDGEDKKTEDTEDDDETGKKAEDEIPRAERATSLVLPEFGEDADPLDPWPLSEEEAENEWTKCWYRCGTWTTLFPLSIIVIILTYSLILPFFVYSMELEIQFGETAMFPRSSKHVHTYRRTRRAYTSGMETPFNVRIKNPLWDEDQTVWNFTYIADTADIFRNLFRRTNDSHSSINSVNGISVMGTLFLDDYDTYREYYESQLYHQEVDEYVAKEDTVSYFSVVPNWYGTGSNCNKRVRRLRNVIEHQCKRTPSATKYSCYIHGRGTGYVDAIRFLYRTFPIILTCTMALTFAVVGLVFRNFFLPIRLLLTIALPMSLIFGVTVLIYQKGAIDYWHSAGLSSRVDGLHWMVPLMSITLLLGLALDYDIFLYSRVDEYLRHGVPLRNAVVRGVYKTGNIITSAGCIMCFAFFGLLFSNINGVNQFGFIMTVGVLVDTFIIRTSLVPAILSLTWAVTWYPPAKEYYNRMQEWWRGDELRSANIQGDEETAEMQQALVPKV